MSRIGNSPIKLASGVTATVSAANELTVKGPKGELKRSIDRDITIEVKDNVLTVVRPTDQIRHRALHGLYRALINNMVVGVTEGFKK
jgi:large subunit ribosomal protein L6